MKTNTTNQCKFLSNTMHYIDKITKLESRGVQLVESDCPTCNATLSFVENSTMLANEIPVSCPFCQEVAMPVITTSGSTKSLSLIKIS